MNKNAKKVAVCGIFGGLALLLYLVKVFQIPMGFIFTLTPFLDLHISDLPIMIASFCYGPVVGSLIVLIRGLAKIPMTSTGGVGELADLIVSLSYVLPAAIIYSLKKDKKGALLGLGISTLFSAIVACFVNYYILFPAFGFELDSPRIILISILPFNLLKGVIVSALTFLVYKKISNVISKYGAK